MLKSKILLSEDYERFVAFNEKNQGASVNVAYLQGSLVRVFYRSTESDRWVAGYAVNAQAPFRYLGVLASQQQCTGLLLRNQLKETNLVEITLLVRDRHLPWKSGDRMLYYAVSLLDALKTGRQFVLGGTIDENLRKAQMTVLRHLLYEGDLHFFGKVRHGWLYYGSRSEVIWNFTRFFVGSLLLLVRTSGAGPRPIPTGSLPNN